MRDREDESERKCVCVRERKQCIILVACEYVHRLRILRIILYLFFFNNTNSAIMTFIF